MKFQFVTKNVILFFEICDMVINRPRGWLKNPGVYWDGWESGKIAPTGSSTMKIGVRRNCAPTGSWRAERGWGGNPQLAYGEQLPHRGRIYPQPLSIAEQSSWPSSPMGRNSLLFISFFQKSLHHLSEMNLFHID